MVDAELQLTNVNNDETTSDANDKESPINANAVEISLLDLKEVLVDIQITVWHILSRGQKTR